MKVRLPVKNIEITVDSVQDLIAQGKDSDEISVFFGKDIEFIRRRLMTLAGVTACDEMFRQISRNAQMKRTRPVITALPAGLTGKLDLDFPCPDAITDKKSLMTVSDTHFTVPSKETTLSDEARYVDKTFSANKKEREWLRGKIEELKYHLKTAADALVGSKAYVDDLEKERQSLKDRIERVKENLWRLPHMVSEAEAEVEKTTEALTKKLSNTKRDNLEHKLADWQHRLTRTRAELDNANAKLERLQIELAATIAEIDDSIEMQERVEVQIEEMETTLKQFNERLAVLERPHFYFRRNEKGEVSLSCENIEKTEDPRLILRWAERLHRYTTEHAISISKSEFYVIVEFVASTIKMDESECVNIVRGKSTDNVMAIIKELTQKK